MRQALLKEVIPSKTEFLRGVRKFEASERNDPTYRVATTHLIENWSDPSGMADAVATLLLIWNRGFYRFGDLNLTRTTQCISKNMRLIDSLRPKSIFDLVESDRPDINRLFKSFLDALSITVDGKIRRSPVATAKVLHLLAPDFLPLWDERIAIKYKCRYTSDPDGKYFQFCDLSKDVAEAVKGIRVIPEGKTLLKLIDEYNYARFTKGWI
jgi:hypothetical protein